MPQEKVISLQIEGGEAKPGPPLGPTLSSLGLNVKQVVDEINERTKDFKGMTIPVKIIVDMTTKKYRIEVGIPTVTALLLREAGASEPSGDPQHKKVGDISLESIIKVTLMVKPKLTAKTLKSAIKTTLGTARSIGLTVNGKDPKDVIKEVDSGQHDDLIAKYEAEWQRS
ncbi:MAG: 50S ribosomal protein L11 [Acidilobus sp.]|jgi:large subunit ribosomal protein L11|nr:50S ribosomal protein L11 [Acidilobus sp.]MCG2873755.1 50S ribosomal protein L11 [Acidilobus sp.]MCG2896672.1 50S ribosomal protein L11 [Acidilobus sp.]